MGKNYNNYYKKHNNEKPKEEIPVEETKVEEAVEEKEPVIETKEVAAPIKEPEEAIVNVDRLNFREKPSKDGNIFTILNKGEEVVLISETTNVAGWSCVSADGKLGYVMTEFIDIKR